MTDVWIGDDFFHNGAFRQTYGYDYVLGMESGKENAFGKLDERMRTSGSLPAPSNHQCDAGNPIDPTSKTTESKQDPNSAHRARIPPASCLRQFLAIPRRSGPPDDRRRADAGSRRMVGPGRPVGTQAEYAALEPHNEPGDPGHRVYLVLGPWRHGNWAQTTSHLGPLDFGEPVGDEFRRHIEAPFFAYYLKSAPGFDIVNTASLPNRLRPLEALRPVASEECN